MMQISRAGSAGVKADEMQPAASTQKSGPRGACHKVDGCCAMMAPR